MNPANAKTMPIDLGIDIAIALSVPAMIGMLHAYAHGEPCLSGDADVVMTYTTSNVCEVMY